MNEDPVGTPTGSFFIGRASCGRSFFEPRMLMDAAEAAHLAALPSDERERRLAALGDDGIYALCYRWRFWARPSQLPPDGDWRVWLLLAGRGFGKTRSGAEWVRE